MNIFRKPSSYSEGDPLGLNQILRSKFLDERLLAQHFGLTREDEEVFPEIYGQFPSSDRPSLSPYFDPRYYLKMYPDVSIDPFLHFITLGIKELRSPHPFLNCSLLGALDREGFGTDRSLESLLEIIEAEALPLSPYFDSRFYRRESMSEQEERIPAILHFLEGGIEQGRTPNQYFDPGWYMERYPDVPKTAAAATTHFVQEGDAQSRYPSVRFDPDWYKSAYPDVRNSGLPPLFHFLAFGQLEGRQPVNPSHRTTSALVRRTVITGHATAANKPDDRDPEAPLKTFGSLRDKLSLRKQMKIEAFREHDVRPVKVADTLKYLKKLKFPAASNPRVSILIPVYNELNYTVECLGSIAQSHTKTPYEVVIADDTSPDPDVKRLSDVQNLRYIRQPQNLGFLRNCNAAFGEIRGDYVLFLNNDAQILPGCIDEMVAVLDENPNVAAVGPKILYPNGRLQEAGCSLDVYGASIMFGLFHDPDEAQYTHSRDVDYCSGAALLVRRLELEGVLFDEQFAPAYCEDVDLCLRLLAKGRRIRYCASASVVHHLSVSTAKESQVKKLQTIVVNQQKLLAKWQGLLSELNTARVIAFYLPQFHPIAQNDKWWGRGFTEWTNVAKALPSYEGHYQPHLPSDLGYYDLRVTSVMEDQFKIARRYGIEGFCLYYYNFGGQRVLETPLEAIVANKSIEFKFCVCWANENWTKHWDGGEKEILLAQDYGEPSLRSIVADILRYSRDVRYIRVRGKPLFLIYRPLLLPDIHSATRLIRELFREGGSDVHLAYVESMEAIEKGIKPEDIGFDAAVEFPPQGIAVPRTDKVEIYKDGWAGHRYDYDQTVIEAVMRKGVPYKRYPGAFPSWDNTPRQPLKGTSFDGATPAAFQFYMEQKLEEARLLLDAEERFVFVNAWNEWAEGAHLEPDQRYGHQWLESISRSLSAKTSF
ncbi:glycoside hydrolase family 99-like domain-containing protein [Bradyrhizobium guangzhouense]|uniref:glycoside hydrolase family 99-like domain-containing protein n=1 Tax=Bradyrhizobium guangzhouense TaxID=1325095 RepID=UPI001009E2C9|nr:glycoside hydrolase family 99-like domain-containing protein [Bradyrhizobium guangzhouense]RXH16962.1 glycosyltransferase [Bradyrhizobium guangzhouense]